MHITDNGRPLSLTDWDHVEVFMLGIDNVAYHANTRLRRQIKNNIATLANSVEALNPLRMDWMQRGFIGESTRITRDTALSFLPAMLEYYRTHEPQNLLPILKRIYDIDYAVIPPQPGFVKAVETLRDHDCRVVINTESPFGMLQGEKMHASKVLEAIGFTPDAFTENDVVDALKPLRNLESDDPFLPGMGFDVPLSSRDRFIQACDALKIHSLHGGYPQIAYLAARTNKFGGLSVLGVRSMLIGQCEKPLIYEAGNEEAYLKIWQDRQDEQGRYYSTTGLLLSKIASLKEIKPRARKYSTKGHYIQEGERPHYLPSFARLEP
jgi:hypothetical protein